jgi:hypothetical protein
VRGRWGSSPRPRARHSQTVLWDTPASRQAAVIVEPRASAMVIVTCTVTFSFVGWPLARVCVGVCKFGKFWRVFTHMLFNFTGPHHPPAAARQGPALAKVNFLAK